MPLQMEMIQIQLLLIDFTGFFVYLKSNFEPNSLWVLRYFKNRSIGWQKRAKIWNSAYSQISTLCSVLDLQLQNPQACDRKGLKRKLSLV